MSRNAIFTMISVMIIFCVAVTVIYVNGYEKEESKCTENGGQFEAVDKRWDITTKTYHNIYACVYEEANE